MVIFYNICQGSIKNILHQCDTSKLRFAFPRLRLQVLPEGSTANVSTDHASDSEDSVSSFRKSADVFIGKVALGKGVRGPTERLHWFSVLQNPRKLVTVWHTLK